MANEQTEGLEFFHLRNQNHMKKVSLVHNETTQKSTKREVGGKEAEACWIELPLLARFETLHQKRTNERQTVNRRSGGEIYKRAAEDRSGGGEREEHWDTEKEGVLHY